MGGKNKSRKVSVEYMVHHIARCIAIERYQTLNLKDDLVALGIDPKTIKRKRGRPPRPIYDAGGTPLSPTPERIVQLVFKQKWQAGRAYTNTYGGDQNPCFVEVAHHRSQDPREIRKTFYGVPKSQRDKIEKWLVQLLHDEGAIHPKKKRKAEKFLQSN